MRKEASRRYSLLQKSFVLIGLFWTIFMASLLTWSIKKERDETTAIIHTQARSFFQQIVTTRYWNSIHGGVYVPVTEETRPNPFLDTPRRDILTEDGQLLTLVNPAFMTRQIADIASERNQVQFHITSLNPIRPGNAPDDWEAYALRNFTKKGDEYYTWWMPNTPEKRAFRYMAPLWTEAPCLSCHSKQGYTEGDLRGGISVTIPANDILLAQDRHINALLLAYLLIWVIGSSGILSFFYLARSEYLERSRLIDNLQNALQEVRTLRGFIPICASCKKVRNDKGYWDQIEKYISDHSEAKFTHGLCPDCANKLYSDIPIDRDHNEDT